MKVKICRQSGLPVDTNDLEIFKEEFRRLFDKASTVCGKNMLRLQTKMAKIERLLQNKYPTVQEVDLPKTAKGWLELQSKYGNILVSQHRDEGNLLFVISDQEEISY